ncbi:MAG: YlxR family protein [Coriobacteriales bacterium]|nr:YlxR family protein [Coriobacteriales bacterium]
MYKDRLVRFVRTPQGVVLDQKGNMPGRGAYACYSHANGANERMRRGLQKTLRIQVDTQAFAHLAQDYDILCAGHSGAQLG